MTGKIIIVSDGKTTQVFVDGKVYGDCVTKIDFRHEAGDNPVIKMELSDILRAGNDDMEAFKNFLGHLLKNE